jgi:16S rRNA processing protein RimM
LKLTDKQEATNPSKPKAQRRHSRSDGDVFYVRNQAVVVPTGYMVVGQVIGVHGLHGELKVETYSDFPERFAPGAVLRLGETLDPVTLQSVRPHKGHLLLKCAEIDDRFAAEDCRDLWLYVPETDAAPLEDGAYWIHDIIGLDVVTTEGVRLGRISDCLATGANDVYVLRPAEGINQGRDVLIPAIADVVIGVDLAQGVMTVHLLDGLLDM